LKEESKNEKEPALSPEDLKVIFYQVEVLYLYHTQFCEQINMIQAAWSKNVQAIAHPFMQMACFSLCLFLSLSFSFICLFQSESFFF
jgi:hypothetical protein